MGHIVPMDRERVLEYQTVTVRDEKNRSHRTVSGNKNPG